MKRLILTLTVAGVALAYPAVLSKAADDDSGPPGRNKNGVPPGLQKKGGLPPGQAKKQGGQPGQSDTTATPATNANNAVTPPSPPTPGTPTIVIITPSTPSTPSAPQSPEQAKQYNKDILERRAHLNQRIEELDALGRQPEVRDRLIARMYRRSDIPIATLEHQEKAHPKVGMGGIMVANTIAKLSKTPVEHVFAEHRSGKSWGEIANDHKVSAVDLIEKVADYHAAARDAEHDARQESARAAAPVAPVIVRAREPQQPVAPVAPEVPRVTIVSPPRPIVVAAVAPKAPEPQQYDKDVLARRARLNENIEELDAMGRRPEVRDRLVARMYRRSDIPIRTLEAQERAHPEVGMGGVMIANTLAKLGKTPVERIFREHRAGKSWGELANEHKVSAVDLLEKVSDYKAAARDAEHDAKR